MPIFHNPKNIQDLAVIFKNAQNNGKNLYFSTPDANAYVIYDVNATNDYIIYTYVGTNPNKASHINWSEFSTIKYSIWER